MFDQILDLINSHLKSKAHIPQPVPELLADERVIFAEPNYIESADGVKKSASIKATISADDKLEELCKRKNKWTTKICWSNCIKY